MHKTFVSISEISEHKFLIQGGNQLVTEPPSEGISQSSDLHLNISNGNISPLRINNRKEQCSKKWSFFLFPNEIKNRNKWKKNNCRVKESRERHVSESVGQSGRRRARLQVCRTRRAAALHEASTWMRFRNPCGTPLSSTCSSIRSSVAVAAAGSTAPSPVSPTADVLCELCAEGVTCGESRPAAAAFDSASRSRRRASSTESSSAGSAQLTCIQTSSIFHIL